MSRGFYPENSTLPKLSSDEESRDELQRLLFENISSIAGGINSICKELKLLNARFEEAFNTKIHKEDV